MDFIEAAVIDLLKQRIIWPDHRQEADAFSNECRSEIMQRFQCDDDQAHQIIVKIWRRLRDQ